MTYFGVTPDGREKQLPFPIQAHLNRTEDAPADEFTGTFPRPGRVGNLTGIHLYDKKGSLCFDGIVDAQKESGAAELTLIARSRAALLLDNEAIPQTYGMPSLTTIFARHVQPYGFEKFLGDPKGFTGEFTVSKGMSEWQVAADFCTRFLNVKPRIVGSVFDASGQRPEGEIRFDNTAGVRYSEITAENKYSALYSELLVQGTNGGYTIRFPDEYADSLGIRRRRCLTLGQNPAAVYSSAHRNAFAVKVACPGEVPSQLLQTAFVQNELLGEMGSLAVSEIDYSLSKNGELTRFTLRRDE